MCFLVHSGLKGFATPSHPLSHAFPVGQSEYGAFVGHPFGPGLSFRALVCGVVPHVGHTAVLVCLFFTPIYKGQGRFLCWYEETSMAYLSCAVSPVHSCLPGLFDMGSTIATIQL